MLEPIKEWIKNNQPDEDLIYKDGLHSQVGFVFETIPSIFARSFAEYKGIQDRIKVFGTHHSKSVCLPVFYVQWQNLTFIMRNNFYDWKVSIRTTHHIPEINKIDWRDLVYDGVTKQIHHVYCEGMKESNVYPPISEYGKDDYASKFTIAISDNYKLYAFLWILRNLVEPLGWVEATRMQSERENFASLFAYLPVKDDQEQQCNQ